MIHLFHLCISIIYYDSISNNHQDHQLNQQIQKKKKKKLKPKKKKTKLNC